MSTTKFARPAVVYIAAGLLSHAGAYYLGLSEGSKSFHECSRFTIEQMDSTMSQCRQHYTASTAAREPTADLLRQALRCIQTNLDNISAATLLTAH